MKKLFWKNGSVSLEVFGTTEKNNILLNLTIQVRGLGKVAAVLGRRWTVHRGRRTESNLSPIVYKISDKNIPQSYNFRSYKCWYFWKFTCSTWNLFESYSEMPLKASENFLFDKVLLVHFRITPACDLSPWRINESFISNATMKI